MMRRMEKSISTIINRGQLLMLVLIALVITSSVAKDKTTCPADIPATAAECLSKFDSQMDQIYASETLFFTGIDAETIRSQICSDHSTYTISYAKKCIHRLQNACPATQHDQINNALTPHIAALQLCHHKDFFEEYAMIQNCFSGHETVLGTCYQDFKSRTQRHTTDVREGRRSAVIHYCGQLTELIKCARSKVSTCGHKADQLVQLLVKLSVEFSYKCEEDLHHATTPSARSVERGSYNSYNAASSIFTSCSVDRTVLLLLQLLTLTVLCLRHV